MTTLKRISVKDHFEEIEGVLPGESATARAAHESLKGDRREIRKLLSFLGPAFIDVRNMQHESGLGK
jgi:hypothetical protein